MSALTPKQMQELETKLRQLKSELLDQLDRSAETTATVTLDQTLVGRVSRMDAMQQQSVALSTRRLTEQKIKQIDAALNEISDGEYGYCKQCDEDIGFARLQVQPEAKLCIQCQDRADNQ